MLTHNRSALTLADPRCREHLQTMLPCDAVCSTLRGVRRADASPAA